MAKPKQVFYFEHTDLYGGECNYCFLNRFAVMASSERGAVNILSRHIGLNHRFDGMKYVSNSGCTAFYLVDFAFEGCEDFHFERFADYKPINFERSV